MIYFPLCRYPVKIRLLGWVVVLFRILWEISIRLWDLLILLELAHDDSIQSLQAWTDGTIIQSCSLLPATWTEKKKELRVLQSQREGGQRGSSLPYRGESLGRVVHSTFNDPVEHSYPCYTWRTIVASFISSPRILWHFLLSFRHSLCLLPNSVWKDFWLFAKRLH